MKSIINRIALLVACATIVLGTTAFTMPDTKVITVSNKCSFSIDRIYISAVDEDSWGNDLLDETEVLAPNATVDIEVDCGNWDVKLVASDGSTCEMHNVHLCSADIWEVHADCAAE